MNDPLASPERIWLLAMGVKSGANDSQQAFDALADAIVAATIEGKSKHLSFAPLAIEIGAV